MSMQDSAWINIIEKDKSQYTPTTIPVEYQQFFIVQKKGIVNKPVLIDDQQEFEQVFGNQNPTETKHVSSLAQYNFVGEHPQYVMRVQRDASYQGQAFTFDNTNGSTGQGLNGSAPVDLDAFTLSPDVNLQVFQKYQGEWGNDIIVKFTPISVMDSAYQNQWKLDVLDTDGNLLETWTVSTDPNLVDAYGKSYYITEVLKQSKLITVKVNENNNFDFNSIIPNPTSKTQTFTYDGSNNTFNLTPEVTGQSIIAVTEVQVNSVQIDNSQYTISTDNTQVTVNNLTQSDTVQIVYSYIVPEDTTKLTVEQNCSGGDDGADLTDLSNQDNITQIINQLNIYVDDEEYDFAYLVNGGWVHPQIQNKMVQVCAERKDQIQLLDAPDYKNIDDVVDYVNGMSNGDSHGQIFYPYLKVNNPFNGVEMHVPPTYEIQKNFVTVDNNLGYHHAVQGLENGVLVQKDTVVKLKKADRDILYNNRINPIQKFNNMGIFIWGNKTLQNYYSKLDRLTQRRVVSLQVIKWQNRTFRGYIFSPYNQSSLSRLNDTMQSFVRDIQLSGQVEDIRYRIETTPDLRNQNTLNIYIDLIPVGSIEYINLVISVYPSGQFTIKQQ